MRVTKSLYEQRVYCVQLRVGNLDNKQCKDLFIQLMVLLDAVRLMNVC